MSKSKAPQKQYSVERSYLKACNRTGYNLGRHYRNAIDLARDVGNMSVAEKFVRMERRVSRLIRELESEVLSAR